MGDLRKLLYVWSLGSRGIFQLLFPQIVFRYPRSKCWGFQISIQCSSKQTSEHWLLRWWRCAQSLSTWWTDQCPLGDISLVSLIRGKVWVCLLLKWQRAMVLLYCVALRQASERCCQISSILHISSHILCNIFSLFTSSIRLSELGLSSIETLSAFHIFLYASLLSHIQIGLWLDILIGVS